MSATTEKDNPMFMSWHNSSWIPHLNRANIMDYFGDRSNPFYDRTCNNEIIKMQRVNPEQLKTMTGLEYELLHVQEPILYVIRKQHRHSIEHTTPLANYYIIAGVVYQAPDLCSVLNSRMLTAGHHIESAFEEAQSYSRYHPSKGYWWEFKDKDQEKAEDKQRKKNDDAASSMFQRQRVDVLLLELAKKFPPKVIQTKPGEKPIPVISEQTNGTVTVKDEPGQQENHNGTMAVTAVAAVAAGAAVNTPSSTSPGAFFSGGMKPPMVKKRKRSQDTNKQ